MSHFVELVTFKTKAGVTPEQVVSAAAEVNRFLTAQGGFISRHLGQSEDGAWHDILFWESRDSVMAAMEKAMSSAHCAGFFGLIDEAEDNMALFPALMSVAG